MPDLSPCSRSWHNPLQEAPIQTQQHTNHAQKFVSYHYLLSVIEVGHQDQRHAGRVLRRLDLKDRGGITFVMSTSVMISTTAPAALALLVGRFVAAFDTCVPLLGSRTDKHTAICFLTPVNDFASWIAGRHLSQFPNQQLTTPTPYM